MSEDYETRRAAAMKKLERDPGPPWTWHEHDSEAGLREHPEIAQAALKLLAEATKEFRDKIAHLPFAGLERTFSRVDAFGCFFDPTGWDRTRDNRKFNAALVEAAAQFHHQVGALMQGQNNCKPIHSGIVEGWPCPACGLPGTQRPAVDAEETRAPEALP